MTRMTGPDCAVMCNLINTHTHKEKRGECAPSRLLSRGFRNIIDPPFGKINNAASGIK